MATRGIVFTLETTHCQTKPGEGLRKAVCVHVSHVYARSSGDPRCSRNSLPHARGENDWRYDGRGLAPATSISGHRILPTFRNQDHGCAILVVHHQLPGDVRGSMNHGRRSVSFHAFAPAIPIRHRCTRTNASQAVVMAGDEQYHSVIVVHPHVEPKPKRGRWR